MTKRCLVLALICVAAVLCLVSCGGDGDDVNSMPEASSKAVGYDFVYRIVPNEAEFDETELEQFFNRLVMRLDFMGYDAASASLYTDESGKEHFVKVELPYSCDKADFDRKFTEKALFEVRDCHGNVILDGTSVVDSYPELIETEDGGLEFAVKVYYNEEGAVKLGQATETISAYAEGENRLDFYFDGELVGSSVCEGIVSTGVSVVSRKGMTETEAVEMSGLMNIGALKYELVLDSAEERA